MSLTHREREACCEPTSALIKCPNQNHVVSPLQLHTLCVSVWGVYQPTHTHTDEELRQRAAAGLAQLTHTKASLVQVRTT